MAILSDTQQPPGYVSPPQFEELREYFYEKTGRSGINASNGNAAFMPYSPSAMGAGRVLLDERMKLYLGSDGQKDVRMQCVPYFAQELGIKPGEGKLTDANLIPGMGVTNLFSAMMEILTRENEKEHPGVTPVMLTTGPTYGLFTRQPRFEGAEVHTVELSHENGWRMTPEMLDKALTDIADSGKRVVAYYNINPHNPTGHVMDREEVEALAPVFKKHGVMILDDLIYKGIELGDRKAEAFASVPGMFDQCITMVGMAKAFCAADFRSVMACGPEKYVQQISSVIARTLSSVPSACQVPMVEAFSMDPEKAQQREDYLHRNAEGYRFRANMMEALLTGEESIMDRTTERDRERIRAEAEKSLGNRQLAADLLEHGIPGVKLLTPNVEAGYFHMVDFSDFKGQYVGGRQLNTGEDLVKGLVDGGRVLALPGGALSAGEDYEFTTRMTFGCGANTVAKTVRAIYNFSQAVTPEPSRNSQVALAQQKGGAEEARGV